MISWSKPHTVRSTVQGQSQILTLSGMRASCVQTIKSENSLRRDQAITIGQSIRRRLVVDKQQQNPKDSTDFHIKTEKKP